MVDNVGVDQDRQATARARKSAIISSLTSGFNRSDPNSFLSAFMRLIEEPEPRLLLANADIDGLVSAQMLSAYTGWRIAGIVDREGKVSVHPSFGSPQALIDTGRVFGVDVFSPLFPSASNHPVYFGATARTHASVRTALQTFDETIAAAVQEHKSLNPSAWVGIHAMLGSDKPNGIPYKYPLGTAQFLLAVIEAAGLQPKLFDRQYLPWLIANCDGGVDTIRVYAWNAEMWWGALAAVVGPASHSEHLFQLVSNQRPNEFLDVDRRLRYDEPHRSKFLDTKWNLANRDLSTLTEVAHFITDLSEWPDPFMDGSGPVDAWVQSESSRGVLPVGGITRVQPTELVTHLASGMQALHVNFSVFKERGTALGWMLPKQEAAVEAVVGDAPVEAVAEDEPSVPEAAIEEVPPAESSSGVDPA